MSGYFCLPIIGYLLFGVASLTQTVIEVGILKS